VNAASAGAWYSRVRRSFYQLAVATFGQHGANELFYLVGLYALVSVTLNAFSVPVPERE